MEITAEKMNLRKIDVHCDVVLLPRLEQFIGCRNCNVGEPGSGAGDCWGWSEEHSRPDERWRPGERWKPWPF